MAGADGWTSGLLNMVPAEARRLWDMIRLEEDYQGALRFWWERFVPRRGGAPEFSPFAMEVLHMRGQVSGYPRHPCTAPTGEFKETLRRLLIQLELVH